MKKKIVGFVAIAAISVSACLLTACGLFGGEEPSERDDRVTVMYHLNGGYHGGDPANTEDYTYSVIRSDRYSYEPFGEKKDTWYLEGWYFDEEFTEKFSHARFVELYEIGEQIDFYANWVDRVTVTKDNFTEFFKVSSRWNGGLTAGGNAAIIYSFEPVMAYDPTTSAQNIEISVTPHLGDWSNGSTTVYLESDDDYYHYGQKRVDSSAAGTEFQIGSSTLTWSLVTTSFELTLLHRDPITIQLDLDGGECDTDTITKEGGSTLSEEELPTPHKEGYRFMGWYTDVEYENEYEERLVTRERTLYAKFVREVTVTFHSNGGTEKEALKLLEGEYISTGAQPQKDNCKFMGWYTDPEFNDKFDGGKVGQDPVDLYARWETLRTIKFETNGGSTKDDIIIADTETPKLGADPTKDDLKFLGWYTDAACTQKYEAGPVSGDLTLYALWVRQVQLSNMDIDTFKQYVDIEIKEEYTKLTENHLVYDIRKFTLTVTVKEQYRKLGFFAGGAIGIYFTNDKGENCGNGRFEKLSLSTSAGAYTYTGEYFVKSTYSAYKSSVTYSLRPSLNYVFVNLPENGDLTE